jgi:hypothetical protein
VCFASVGDVGNVNYLEQNIVRLCMFLLSDLGCKIKNSVSLSIKFVFWKHRKEVCRFACTSCFTFCFLP